MRPARRASTRAARCCAESRTRGRGCRRWRRAPRAVRPTLRADSSRKRPHAVARQTTSSSKLTRGRSFGTGACTWGSAWIWIEVARGTPRAAGPTRPRCPGRRRRTPPTWSNSPAERVEDGGEVAASHVVQLHPLLEDAAGLEPLVHQSVELAAVEAGGSREPDAGQAPC